MKNQQHIEMYAGDSHRIEATVTNEDGTLMDVRSATYIEWRILPYGNPKFIPNYDPLLVKKSTEVGHVVLTNPELGQFTIVLQPDDTEEIRGQYPHECIVVDSFGDKVTVFSGVIQLI